MRQALSDPGAELTRWQRTIRYGISISRTALQHLRRDRANSMAAALAYRSLFSLIPILVVSAAIATSFVGEDRMLELVSQVVEDTGLNEIGIRTGEEEIPEPSATLGSWIESLTENALDIDLTSLTWTGILLLIYAALALMVTAEKSFNDICSVTKGRPWIQRIIAYWFILSIGPFIAGLGLYIDHHVEAAIEGVEGPLSILLPMLHWGWIFLVAWSILFTTYRLLPNTRINIRPALIGAAASAFLMLLGRECFSLAIGGVTSVNLLFGSAGLIPLFMFWIFLMWLVVLYGLVITAILQDVDGMETAMESG